MCVSEIKPHTGRYFLWATNCRSLSACSFGLYIVIKSPATQNIFLTWDMSLKRKKKLGNALTDSENGLICKLYCPFKYLDKYYLHRFMSTNICNEQERPRDLSRGRQMPPLIMFILVSRSSSLSVVAFVNNNIIIMSLFFLIICLICLQSKLSSAASKEIGWIRD